MRKITIRQLQQNMFRELENLPVVITRKGIDTFIIRGIENVTTSDNVTTSKSQDVTTIKDKVVNQLATCHYPYCNNPIVEGSEYCKSHK
jgi:hypothetical protein